MMQQPLSEQIQTQANYCQIHPKRILEFVCLRQKCTQRFFCSDCFRSDTHFDHLEQTFILDEVINCDDEYEFANQFFKLGDQVEENQILQQFIQLKENINAQIDTVLKSIMIKIQNFKIVQNEAKRLAQQFQEDIQKFTQNKLNTNNANKIVEDFIKKIQQAGKEQKQMIVQSNQMEQLQSQIADSINNFEKYVIEGKRAFPTVNQIVEQNQQLVLQYLGDKLKVQGYYGSMGGQTKHNFKLDLLNDKTYCIEFSIYRDQNYTQSLQFVTSNNQIYDIQFLQNQQQVQQKLCLNCHNQINNLQNETQWLSIKYPTESRLNITNNFQLQQGKNDYLLKFCQQKQQLILFEVSSNSTYQLAFQNQLDQSQRMYFTFKIVHQQKEQRQQLQESLVQLMDFHKIYYY